MRNSGKILKWTNNKTGKPAKASKDDNKKWIHSPETLQHGHVVYLVKFLGSTEVDQPKGIEVVKQGIQKLKFNQMLKKNEGQGSSKTPKVELTISVDGVVIQEPKTKAMMHQYPLHKISYCADDKAEKRFFSFIAREEKRTGDDEGTNRHTCFVFVSDKLAEEITLTIGQAFELAYKRFLDISGKEMETKKRLMTQEKRIEILERENAELKRRLRDVANIKGANDVKEYLRQRGIVELTEVDTPKPPQTESENKQEEEEPAPARDNDRRNNNGELIVLDAEETTSAVDGLSLDDLNDDDFNPRAESSEGDDDDDENVSNNVSGGFKPSASAPVLHMGQKPGQQPIFLAPPARAPARAAPAPPPPEDIFSRKSDPFGGHDPFGMDAFSSSGVGNAFQTGMAQSAATFSLEELDPLKK